MISQLIRTILFLAVSTLQLSASTLPCKIAEGWVRLNERLHQEGVTLGQKLSSKIDGDPTIAAATRFQNHPSGLNPRLAAQNEIDESLGLAEEIAPTLLGDGAAEAWINTATLPRVVATEDISYATQGAALGRVAERSQNAGLNPDQIVKEILESRRANFDPANPNPRPWAGKYHESHYLRDMGDVAEHAAANNVNIGSFLTEQKGQAAGRPFEARLAAARKSEGLVALAADNLYEGADVVTQASVYNAGLTLETISNKLATNADINKLTAAILDAANNGLPYQFAVSDKSLSGQGLIDLQNRLASLDSAVQAARPGLQRYNLASIILEEFK